METSLTERQNSTMNTDTKAQAQHSPLPWHISRLDDDERMIRDVQGADMAVVVGATEANAKLIVASVNNAGKLAEACRIAQEYIGGADTSGSAQRRAHSALFVALAAYEEARS